jgi:YVTN family beta-propeller protein
VTHPTEITDDGQHLWVTNWSDNSVAELNASDGSLVRIISGPAYHFSGPWKMAADGPDIWVTNSYQFNEPNGIAVAGNDIWVASQNGNSVTEFNAKDGSPVRILSGTHSQYGFDNSSGIALAGGLILVTNQGSSTVTAIDAATGKLVKQLPGFHAPYDISVAGSHVWIDNTQARNGQSGGSVAELTIS